NVLTHRVPARLPTTQTNRACALRSRPASVRGCIRVGPPRTLALPKGRAFPHSVPKPTEEREMHTRVTRVVAVLVWAASVAAAQHLDLSQATIVADTSSPVLENAVDMLQDEIERRTGIRPALAMSEPPKDAPAIVV